MDWQLKNQLKETAIRARFSSVSTDGYAEPTLSSSVSLTCRIIGKQRYVQRGDQQVLSVKQLVSTGIVGERDRVWLPGESTSSDQGWEVLMAQVCIDEAGSTDYYRAFLGKGQVV